MLLDNFSLAGRAWGGGMALAADAADAGAASAAKGGERRKKEEKSDSNQNITHERENGNS